MVILSTNVEFGHCSEIAGGGKKINFHNASMKLIVRDIQDEVSRHWSDEEKDDSEGRAAKLRHRLFSRRVHALEWPWLHNVVSRLRDTLHPGGSPHEMVRAEDELTFVTKARDFDVRIYCEADVWKSWVESMRPDDAVKKFEHICEDGVCEAFSHAGEMEDIKRVNRTAEASNAVLLKYVAFEHSHTLEFPSSRT